LPSLHLTTPHAAFKGGGTLLSSGTDITVPSLPQYFVLQYSFVATLGLHNPYCVRTASMSFPHPLVGTKTNTPDTSTQIEAAPNEITVSS